MRSVSRSSTSLVEFAEACAANNADIIQFVGTNNAARDIDALRRSLGEEEISYLGWSYGAELGGTWATLFPSTVRAAVFDSAPDPHAEQLEAGLRQSEGFEQALSTYLAECSADPSCAFHNDGDAEGAFDELMLELDANPIPSIEGRPEITRGVALTAVAQAMYGDSLWPDLSRALDSAQRGNGTALLRLYDEYFGYNVDGTWGNELEAFQTIVLHGLRRATLGRRGRCHGADVHRDRHRAWPRTPPVPTSARSSLRRPNRASRSPVPAPARSCSAAPPVDASTPLEGTRAMAESLEDGHLIVVDAVSSGCWGASECAEQLITDYLVDLDVPATETDCAAN